MEIQVPVSFKNDVFPLYTPDDVAHIERWFDLFDKDDNVQNDQIILNRLQGIGGSVTPPPPHAWTQAKIDFYEQWIADGFSDWSRRSSKAGARF
jgi:hypothetical protein